MKFNLKINRSVKTPLHKHSRVVGSGSWVPAAVTNVLLKHKSPCSFSEISVSVRSCNTLGLKVCADFFFVFALVPLIQ